MTSLYDILASLLSSHKILLYVEIISFCITTSLCIYFISKFYQKTDRPKKASYPFYFFLTAMIGLSVENVSWIAVLVKTLNIVSIHPGLIKFLVYIAWIFNMIRYQALGLFLESLTQKNFIIRKHHKLFFFCTAIFSSLFVYGFIVQSYSSYTTQTIVTHMLPIIPIYSFIMIIPSLIITFTRLFDENIPKLIRKQLKITFSMILFPHTFFDLVQTFPLFFHFTMWQDNIAGAILSNILINVAFIFFARNIFNFRFLNTTRYISSRHQYFNNKIFKETIEQISKTSYTEELGYITQGYFKENFKLPMQNVWLHIRNSTLPSNVTTDRSRKELQDKIENFINNPELTVDPIEILKEQKLVVQDEVEFNAFYTSLSKHIVLTDLLKTIDCSLFVPIFYKNNLVGYITIKKHDTHHFFNIHEQNNIYVLANYLGHMIQMINTINPQTLLRESQQLKQELFLKHQEANQYKECMKNLLQKNVKHSTGVLFYKNNMFFFGNKAAQDLININLNQQKNHPITHTLKEIAHNVILFKSTQNRFLTIQNDEKLLVTGIPHIETKNSVILTIQYPEASDIIKKNVNKLQNPSQWDYALYLETTRSGKLINELVPSNQEQFLNFKIKLLEAALTHKGLLLQCHPDDLQSIAELIHHVSLKEKLHIIDLQGTEYKDIYIKLFGVNGLLKKNAEEALLKKLDRTGTLFIKNIEQLDHNTQQELATFINYGYFSPLKSHEKIFCSVRIIFSTNQTPQSLLDRGILLPKLYEQLHSTILKMPSLVTLKDEEIQELIDGMTHQSVKDQHFAHLPQLSDEDYQTIIDRKPASLKELTTKVHSLLSKKSNKHTIFKEKTLDHQFETSHPDLVHAAQLGKYALKDEKLMALLWNTFKSQTKIAQYLGVNRSSVNRRCKAYNLY